MKVTLVTMPCHVDTLSESQLDGLLDRYFFVHDPWCRGAIEIFYPLTGPVGGRCAQCGAVYDMTIAERLFGPGGHPRQIPHYSLEQLLEAMKRQERTTQICIALALRVNLGGSCLPRSPTSAVLHVLFALTTRHLKIALLHALGIIDTQGMVQERRR